MARKYGKKASEKVARTMHEFKRGKLNSGSGNKVTSRKQAIAIGLSQARRVGGKVPSSPRRHATKKPPSQLNREIAEALSNAPADQWTDQWTMHGRIARMTSAEKKRELKDLQHAKENYFRALGYAGNTPDQVRKYHDAIAEIDAKMKLFK